MAQPGILSRIIDSAVAAVSPSAALARQRSRAALGTLHTYGKRASGAYKYEAASAQRGNMSWWGQPSSPTTDTAIWLRTIRERSRDLYRNNAYAKAAIDTVVAHHVGFGIRPRSAVKPSRGAAKRVNDARMSAWRAWAESTECDWEGRNDLYGLQALWRRAMAQDGEVIVRMRSVPMSRGITLPIQLQTLEGDYLDHGRDGPLENGGAIIQGIEFDKDMQRIAYHLYKWHPSDTANWGTLAPTTVRVPAAEIVHGFRNLRPGQVRGVPELHAAMVKLEDLGTHEDAWLMRSKIEACLCAIVQESGDGQPPPTLGPTTTTDDGDEQQTLSPGAIIRTRPGQAVTSIAPSSSGGQIEFTRQGLRAVSASFGIGYDQISADVSQANYSTIRAARLEFRKRTEQYQWHVMIPTLCNPIWVWFCTAGYAAGLWDDASPDCEWTPPRFEMVDPTKDGPALRDMVRIGAMTWPQMVSEQGYDPEEQAAAIAESNARLDALGIVVDCDPRRTTGQGQGQPDPMDTQQDTEDAEGEAQEPESSPTAPVIVKPKRKRTTRDG